MMAILIFLRVIFQVFHTQVPRIPVFLPSSSPQIPEGHWIYGERYETTCREQNGVSHVKWDPVSSHDTVVKGTAARRYSLGPVSADIPELIRSRARKGLQEPETISIPLERGGLDSELSDSSDLNPLCQRPHKKATASNDSTLLISRQN